MAVLAMNRISIFGFHADRKAILEELHKMEAIEIHKPDLGEATFMDTAKSIAQFEKYIQSAESALGVLGDYKPVKTGFISSRRALPIQDYHMATPGNDDTLRVVHRIINLSEKIRERRESIRQIEAKQMALEPYLTLDVPMDTRATEYTVVKTGTLAGIWSAQRLAEEGKDTEGYLPHVEILGYGKDMTYVWMVYPKSRQPQTEAFLQKTGFAEPSFSLSHHPPQKKTEVLAEAKRALAKEIRGLIREIEEKNSCRRDIELFHDHMSLRRDKYRVLASMGMTEHVFYLDGYVPARLGENVKETLERKWKTHVELSKPGADEDVPTAFHNNAFVSPVQGITETYSMPSSSDVDPNPVMAFFYYLFFGMMFSDAGYGLLVAIVCGYLGYSRRLEIGKRRNYKMFCLCGVSTVFWGIMYGSFFGNIIYTISTSFFGTPVSFAPIWLDPITQAMELMIFSVALGMIQILIALGIKFYVTCRQKKVLDAILDTGLWMLVLIGISLLAGGMGLQSPGLTDVGTWVAIAGFAGLLVTGGRNSKNIIGKVFGGVIGLYDIAGYVSDILSYCRLMALGLATGAIGNVVNMLGATFGSSIVGVIIFAVIALFGHALNFGMNILGAYVHTNRLQYVEFFSKFYEGGGRKFSPFRMDTKYVTFSNVVAGTQKTPR